MLLGHQAILDAPGAGDVEIALGVGDLALTGLSVTVTPAATSVALAVGELAIAGDPIAVVAGGLQVLLSPGDLAIAGLAVSVRVAVDIPVGRIILVPAHDRLVTYPAHDRIVIAHR